MEELLHKVLSALENPGVKYVGLMVGGWLLKQTPQVVNKAIPLTLLVASVVVSVVNWLFPGASAGGVQPAAVYQYASFWSTFTGQLIGGAVLPFLLAVGTQSALKNTNEWRTKYGFKFFV